MKKTITFILSLLMLIVIVNAVSNPKPTITARFNETVTILAQNLTYINEDKNLVLLWKNPTADFEEFTNPLTVPSSTGSYPDEPSKEYYDYLFKPKENLKEGNYTFNITSEDDLDNQKNSSYRFTIKYEPLKIGIESPSYGVSYDETFNITVITDRNAQCKHANENFPYDVMDDFDEVEADESYFGRTFNIKEGPFVMSATVVDFYVKCKDSLYNQEHLKKFNLIVDKTPPQITIVVDPKAIYEGSGPFEFNVTVTTDDDTVCNYNYTGEDYDAMRTFSDIMNKTHRKKISTYDVGKQEYNLKCNNSAGLISNLYYFSFLVNLTLPTQITLINPTEWVTQVPFSLEVETTKRAVCKYQLLPNTEKPSFGEGLTYSHAADISPSDGIHTYKIDCRTTQGTIEKEFEIKVDRKYPEKPTVTIDGIEEGSKKYTYRTDRLSAELTSKDVTSGIYQFNYSIINDSNKEVIDEGLTDAGNCDENKTCTRTITVDGLELQDKSQYFFRVTAIDLAGWTSDVKHSDKITIDTSKKPIEKIKPRGWIAKQDVDDGIKVTLHCVDQGTDKSGCAPGLYEYDAASSKEECRYQTYIEPVIIEETSWFCWSVSDNAENIAEGAEQITIVEPERRDRDNDGVLDIEDNCPITPNEYQEDTDSDDIGDECDNCHRRYNPSQYDSDNDGIGDSCDTCADTPSGASVNSYGCSMTQQPSADVSPDRDNDGMPDDWEEDNSLDPDDPNDADLDNDEDGLTNVQEYNYRTNPLNKDTDGDEFSDLEEIDAGTDPLDPDSKPKKGSVWSVLLLILGILILLGGLGYLGYTYFLKDKIGFKPSPIARTPAHGIPHGLGPMQRRPIPGRPMQRRQLTPQQHGMLMQRKLKKKMDKQEERKKAFGAFMKKPESKPEAGLKPEAKAKAPITQPAKKYPLKKPAFKPKVEEEIKPVPKPHAKPKSAIEKLKTLEGKKKKKEDIFSRLSLIRGKKK